MFSFNLVRWFKSLCRPRVKTLGRRPNILLHLEELEARVTPTLYTWTGAHEAAAGVAFDQWSDPNNWISGGVHVAPVVSAITPVELQFDSTGYFAKPNFNDLNGLIVDQLTIASGSYTLMGNQFELGSPSASQGTITVNTGIGNESIINPIQFGSNTAASTEFLQVQSAATLTLSGQLTSTNTTLVTEKGPGTLTLTANNSATFLGPYTISNTAGNGTTIITDPNALGNGSSAANTVTINANTELQVNLAASGGTVKVPLVISGYGTNGIDGAIVMNPAVAGTATLAGTITMNASSAIGVEAAGDTLNITGVISDANVSGYSLTKEGPGTLFLNPNNPLSAANNFDGGNQYHGNTYVNGGELQIGQPYALGVGGATTVVSSNNVESGTLALNYAGNTQIPAGDLVYAQVQTVAITGAPAFTLSYNGVSTLPISYGAAISATVQGDLNALATIGGIGASVTVNQVGSTLYIVFQGSLGGLEIPTVSATVTSGVGTATVAATTGSDPTLPNGLSAAFTAPIGFIVPNEFLTLNGPGMQGVHVNFTNNSRTLPTAGAITTGTGALSNTAGDNSWEETVTFWSTPSSVAQAFNAAMGYYESTVAIGAALDTNLTIDGQIVDNGVGTIAADRYSFSKVGAGRLILTNNNTNTSDVDIINGILNIRDSHALGSVPISVTAHDEAWWGASLELQADGIPDSQTGTYNLTVPPVDTLWLNGPGFNSEGALDNVSGVNIINVPISLQSSEPTTVIGVAPDPDPTNIQGATWNDLSQLTINGIISAPLNVTTLTKTGYGELVLTNDNTYIGPNSGQNTYETFINQGWITTENDFALGGTLGNRNPIDEPGVEILPGAALVLKQDPAGNSLTLNYNISAAGSGLNLPEPLAGLEPYLNQTGAILNLDGLQTLAGNIYLEGIPITFQGTMADTAENLITADPTSLTGGFPYIGTEIQTLGTSTTSETQVLDFAGAVNGGTFTLTFNGQTTAPILWSPIGSTIAGNIEAALDALSNIGLGNVNVGGVNAVGIGVETDGSNTYPYPSQLTTTGTILDGDSNGELVKLGSQRLILQGNGLYTGGVDIQDGVVRIQNSDALGTGSSSASYTTTVENGTALELYPTDPLLTGGNEQGLEVWYINLVLNGTGDAAFGDAALTVPSNDNMWRGPITLNSDVAVAFDAPNSVLTAGPVPLMTANSTNLVGGSVTVASTTPGGSGLNAVQTLNFTPGIASGSFTLNVTNTEAQNLVVAGAGTFDLSFTGFSTLTTATLVTPGLTAASLQSALNTLLQTAGAPGYVSATSFGIATVTGTGPFLVSFSGTLLHTLVPLMIVEDLTGTASVTPTFQTATTAAIPWNSSVPILVANIQSALNAISSSFNSAGVSLVDVSLSTPVIDILPNARLTVTGATVTTASPLIHDYEFQNTYADLLGGPALVPTGGVLAAHSYTWAYVPNTNQGLSLTGALPNVSNYTIQMDFDFTNVPPLNPTGYNRIIDFKGRLAPFTAANPLSDDGLYEFGTAVDAYPGLPTGPNGQFVAGVPLDLIVMRDGATGQVTVYINGVPELNFIDAANDFVALNTINFFIDDLFTPNEISAGTITSLKIYDRPLTPSEVAIVAPGGYLPSGTTTAAIQEGNNPADLTVIGGGELSLTGADTYQGTTYVKQGVLTISNPAALGGTGVAAVQQLTLAGMTAGTSSYTLSFPDGPGGTLYTTPAIPYTGNAAADASVIQTDLNNLKSIGSAGGSVTVTPVSSTVFDITFDGNFLGFNQPNLTPSALGSGSAIVLTQTTGAGGTVVSAGAQLQLQGAIDVINEPLMIQGQGIAQEPEEQLVSAAGTPAGTFTVGFTNPATQLLSSTTLSVGATAAQVQTALNALLSIQQGEYGTGTAASPLGSVIVIETGVETYTVIFGGNFTALAQGLIVPAQILSITNGAAGDTFTLSFTGFAGLPTAPITYSGNLGDPTDAAAIQAALNTVLATGGSPGYVSVATHGSVASVTANADGTYTIFFGGTLAGVIAPTLVPGNLTGTPPTVTVNATGVTTFTTELIQGGSANATPTQWFTSGPAPVTSGAVNITTVPSTQTADLSGPITSIAVDPFDGQIIYITTAGGGAWKSENGGTTWEPLFNGVSTVQKLTITGSNPITDTFTITFTNPTTGLPSTTVTLPYNATPDQIQAALDAIVGVGNSVSVSQDINTNGVNEVQEIVLNTSTTTWTSETADPIHYTRYYLKFNGQTTAAVPYMGNAALDQVAIQTALDALIDIGGLVPTPGSVNVTVDPTPPGALGSLADEAFFITFQGALADSPEPIITFTMGASANTMGGGGHGHGGGPGVNGEFWTINPGGVPSFDPPVPFPTINNIAATIIGPNPPNTENNSDAGSLFEITHGTGPTITDTITFSGGGLANINVAALVATPTPSGAATVVPAIVQQGVGAQAAMFSGNVIFGATDNILFLGTGVDNDAPDPYYGTGVYESTDFGQTWNLLVDPSLAAPNPLYGMSVNKMVLDPVNNDIYVATSDIGTSTDAGVNTPGDSPTLTHPGVWRYDLTTDNWLDLTDITSTDRATVASGQGTPPNFPFGNPPMNPGPDDNYILAFPQTNASWSDLQIVNSAADGGVILYAALGTTGNSAANGVYWIAAPATVTIAAGANPASWWLGDPGSPPAADNRDANQFPTTAPPDYFDDPPAGPFSNGLGDFGNIQIAVLPGGGAASGSAFNPNADDAVLAAVTYSTDANNPNPNQFFLLALSVDSAQDWGLLNPQPTTNYQDNSGNHNSAILTTNTDLYVGGADSGGDAYVYDLNLAAGTWTNISLDASGNGPHTGIHTFAFLGNTLYVGTTGGMWTYNTTTGLWSDINGNLGAAEINYVASDPTNPNIVFGGGRGVGVVEYTGDENWTQVESNVNTTGNLDTLNTGSVAVDPNNSNYVYAIFGEGGGSGGGTLTVSTNGGVGGAASTWKSVYTDNVVSFPIMVVDNFSRVFVGGSVLVVSSNQGASFTNLAAPIVAPSVTAKITEIAVADLQGPFTADASFPTITDQGAQNPDAKTIAIVDSNILFVTKNLGVTWVNRSNAAWGGTAITAVSIDPTDRDDIWVALGGPAGGANTGTVWFSANAGQTWTKVSTGLAAGVPARSLAIDPRSGTVYVGTDLGLYVLAPGAVRTWVRFGVGSIPMVSVQSLSLNQTNNILTVGTSGSGVYQFYLDAPAANQGALVATSGTDIWNGPVVLAGPSTISAIGNQNLQNAVAVTELTLLGQISDSTYAASASGANTLTKGGTGDVTLSAANTYTGLTLIDQGDVTIQDPLALGGGAIPSSQELFLAGAVANSTQFNLSFNGSGPSAAITYTGLPANSAGVSVDSAAIQAQLAALIPGTANVAVTQITPGDYLIVFSGSLTGNTVLVSATITAGLGSAFAANDGTTVVTSGSGLLLDTSLTGEPLYLFGNGAENQSGHYSGALENASGVNTYTGTITLENTSTIAVDGTSVLTISSPAVGTQAITDLGTGGAFGIQKEGTGTLILAASDNYQAGTTVNQGILNVQNNNALGLAGTTTSVLDGAQLQLQGYTLAGTLTVGTNTVTGLPTTVGLTVGETVSGQGIPVGSTVTAVGPGLQVTISQNATASGVAQVMFGSVAVTTQNLSLSGTGILNTGALENAGGNNAWGFSAAIAAATEALHVVTITTSSASGFVVGETINITGVTLAGYNGTYTITGVTAGLNQFTYTDPTNGLTASSGGVAGTVIVLNAVLGFSPETAPGNVTIGVLNAGETLVLGSTLTQPAAGVSSPAAPALTMTGGLTKVGLGKLTLTQNDTYSGTNYVNNGILDIQNSGALGAATGNEVQRITTRDPGAADSFTLTFGGSTTAAINFGATAAQVANALNGLGSIGAGGVTVAENDVNSGISQVETETLTNVIAGNTIQWSFGGSVTALIPYTGAVGSQADALAIQAALNNGGFATIGGLAPFAGSVTVTANYTDTVFTITFGGYLADSTQALITGVVGAGTSVLQAGHAVAPLAVNTGVGFPTLVYTITFSGAGFAGKPQALITDTPSVPGMTVVIGEVALGNAGTNVANNATLQLDGDPTHTNTSISPNQTLDIYGYGETTLTTTGVITAGTFTLSVGGQTTGPINATLTGNNLATAVQTALSLLSDVGVGNVTVIASPTNSAYTITFASTVATPVVYLTPTGVVGGIAAVATPGALENFSGNNTWAGAIVLPTTLAIGVDAIGVDPASQLTVTGSIQDPTTAPLPPNPVTPATLAKVGTGTLLLPTANTYTGSNFIDAGAIDIGSVGSLGVNNSTEQTITISGTGTVTIGFTGFPISVTTGALSVNLTPALFAAALQTALNSSTMLGNAAAPGGGTGTATVTALSSGSVFVVTFGGSLTGVAVPVMKKLGTTNTAAVVPAILLAGASSGTYVDSAARGGSGHASLQLPISIPATATTFKPLTINGPGNNNAGALENISGTNIFAPTTVLTGVLTAGSTVVSGLGATSNLLVGGPVSGAGIPAGATIGSIVSGSSITLSTNATVSGSASLTFISSIMLGSTASIGADSGTQLNITQPISDGGAGFGVNIASKSTLAGAPGTGVVDFASASINAYTGPTTVIDGLLQLNDGASGGAVRGNLNVGANTVIDQVQQITLAGFTSGASQFTLTYNGVPTAAITYYSNSAYEALQIQAALNAVLTPISVTVAAAGANSFNVSFGGSIAGTDPASLLSGNPVAPAVGTVSTGAILTHGALVDANAAEAQFLASNQINPASTVTVQDDGLFDLNAKTQSISALNINGIAAAAGTASTGVSGVGGGALTVTGPVQITGGNLNTQGPNDTVTVSGAAASLTMIGGVVNEPGASSQVNVTGPVNITGGTVNISGANSQFNDTGALTMTGGLIDLSNTSSQLNVTGSMVMTSSAAVLLFGTTDSATINGPLSATDSSITESGLNTVETVTGLFTIIDGSVNLSGTGSQMVLDGNVTGNSDASGAADILGQGALTLNDPLTPVFTVNHSGLQPTDLIISAPIVGSQGITKLGVGTLELGGVDSYGATTINAGNVQVDQLGVQTVTLAGFNAGDHFSLTYTSGNLSQQTLAPITYFGTSPTGPASTANSILTQLQNLMTFLGVPLLSSDVSVVPVSANVFTITFTAAAALDLIPMTGAAILPAAGSVTVTNVNNTGAVVLNGGNITGTGTVASITGAAAPAPTNPPTVNLVDPGNSAGATNTGILLTNGNVNLGAGTTLYVDLNNLSGSHPNPAVGVDYDQLNVNGNVTLGGALLSGSITPNVLVGDTYTIVSVTPGHTITGTLSGMVNGALVTIPATNGYVFFGTPQEKFSVTYNTTSVVLTRVLKDVTITISPAPSVSGITSATEVGNTVTIATATAQGLSVGDQVIIAGVGAAGYNGSYTVTSVSDPSHFTYTSPTSGLGNSAGGTATAYLNPSIYGEDVPYIATITAEPGAGNLPAGPTEITFTFDKATLGATLSFAIPAGVSTYTTPQFDPENLYGPTWYFTPGSANTIDVAFKDVNSGTTSQTFNNATATQFVQSVNQNTANILLTSNPAVSSSSPVYGQNVTVTATITPKTPLTLASAFTPTGTATFTLGTTSFTATIVNSFNMSASPTATWTIPASLLSVGGANNVQVTYNGDTYYAASSTPVQISLPIQKNSTSVAVTASPVPSIGSTFGQAATFTATVSANSQGPNGSTPSGTVSFYDGNTVPTNLIGTGTLVNGITSVTTSTLSVFTHTINAVYNGDTNYTGSGGALLYTVNQAPTATTLVSENPDPSNFGNSVVLTANVVASPGINPALGLPVPTGLINFWANAVGAGGVFLGSGTVAANGNASATTPALALTQGTHSIFAVYAGDTNYTTSTGTFANFLVNPAITTTTLTASPAAGDLYGEAISLTASVTFSAGVPTTGSVNFTATNVITSTVTPLGAVNVNSLGKAILSVGAVLPAATYSITASYTDTLPDTSFGASSTSIASYTISKTSTTTAVTATPTSGDVFGESVTFTAAISPVAPGAGVPADGTLVTFKDGATTLGTGTTVSGKATFTTSALTVGFHNITTTYPGDANFNGSTGTFSSYSVGKATSSTALTSTPASGDVVGQSITFTATVTAVAPGVGIPTDGDLITFKDGANVIGTGTTSGGVATLTLSNLAVGAHTISAVFPGDANFNTSTGTINTYTIGKAQTTTAVSSSPASGDVFGEQVTFTATVASVAPGSGTPVNGDIVTFKDGAVTLGTGALVGGVATLGLSNLAVGVHTITATFAGDTNYLASSGNLNNFTPNNYTVAAAPTATTITVSPGTGDIYGEPVTFTAHVAVVSPGVGTPANGDTVAFQDNGVTFGTGTVSAGQASFTIGTLNAGVHSITAVYSGDVNFASSTGLLNGTPINNYVVGQASTVTGLSASPSSNDTYGQSVTLQATVNVVFPGVGTPANGDVVTFLDGVATLGTGTLTNGIAFLTTTNLIAGTHTLTATFGGDTNFATSTGALNGVGANNFTVNQASTVTTLTGTPFSGDVSGEAVTFTATVNAVAPGAGVPANGDIVTFKDGSNTLGNGTISNGVATFTTTALTVGTHSVSATFVGDGNFATSAAGLNGNPFNNYTVAQAATTTTVTSTPAAGSVYGQAVTFTASIAANAPGAGTAANGDVITFKDGGTIIGTAPVSAGVATFTTSILIVGSHTISASFPGDSNFIASSGSLNNVAFNNFAVAVDGTTTTVTASPASGDAFGQTVTFTAAIAAVAPGIGVPANGDTVTFRDGATTLGTGNITGGVATFSTSSLAVGVHTITATFNGDGGLGSSTGSLSNIPLNNYTVGQASTTTTVTAAPATTIFGQAVTFSAVINANAPASGVPANGDLVVFYDAGTQIGSGTTTSGVATFTTTSLLVGLHSITATFAGDTNYVTSTGGLNNVAVNNFTVTQPLTTTTVSANHGNSVFGQSVTFTANVTVNSPGVGTPANGDVVTFLDAGNPIGVGTLSAGVATFTTTGLAAGPHTITASFPGDTNFAASIGKLNGVSGANFTVTTDAVATSVIASPSAGDLFGQTVTLTATLTAVSPGSGTPADGGIITFKDGSTTLGTGTLVGGVATFSTSSLAVGSHNLTANFPGDPNFTVSTGALNSYVVSNAVTSTTVNANPASSDVYGRAITLTATITSPTTAVNGGTVSFYDGTPSTATLLGTSLTVVNGTATITTTNTALPVSPNLTITAVYAGAVNIAGSSGTLTNYAVGQASTTTVVSSSLPISGFGQTVTFTANVAAVSPSTAIVSGGTVTFQDNGATIGTGAVTNGVATFSISSLAEVPVTHSITAIYNTAGTGNFAASSSAPITQSVLAASTTTVTSTTANPSQYGQAISYSITVAGNSGTPIGTVNLYDGAALPANLIAGPLTLVGGTVTGTLSSLGGGSHTITAVYSGEANIYAPSTGTMSRTVTASKTTTALTASPATGATSPVFGQPVNLTAVVTAAFGAAPTSGTVTFTDNTTNKTLGAATLSGSNSVILTTSALSVANHTITASYGGIANDAASSGVLSGYVVHQATTTTSLVSTAPASVYGQVVSFSATVLANAPSGVNPTTGTVTFKDGATVIASIALNGSSNVATFTSSTLTVATHSITATYNANVSYAASTAGAVIQVVSKATTITTVTPSVPGGSQYGQLVTFTASIALANGSLSKPTGTVRFMDGAVTLATVALNGTSNTVIYSTSTLAVNPSHTISAVYTSSNVNIIGSTGVLSPYSVSQAITKTTLTSTPAGWTVGTPISFTAAVVSTGGGVISSGTVQFIDTTTNQVLATGNVVNGKVVATFAGFTSLGVHSVVANYSGTANFAGSASTALTQNIVKVALTTSANPALINTATTFTATVTGAGGIPTGTVSFYDGAKLIGTATLNANGVAALSISTLAQGTHNITAVYNGDGTYSPGTSAVLAESVLTKIGNRLV